jgi:hypothetical protein
MLSLAYPLENEIEIDGVNYQVNLNFDNVIRIYDLLQDDEIDDVTQVETALLMLLETELVCDIEAKSEILNTIFTEMIASSKAKEVPVDIKGNPMPSNTTSEEANYSLKQDAAFIYASFMQDYGIDLIEQQGKLDWRKFLALLDGLRGDTRFKEVMEIRNMELPTGKGTEKQRQAVIKMKEAYKLKKEI